MRSDDQKFILRPMFRAEHEGLAIRRDAADCYDLGGAEHLVGVVFFDDGGTLADRQLEDKSSLNFLHVESSLILVYAPAFSQIGRASCRERV